MSKKERLVVRETLVLIVGVAIILGVVGVIASYGNDVIYSSDELSNARVLVRYAEVDENGNFVRWWDRSWNVVSVGTINEDRVVITVPQLTIAQVTGDEGYIATHGNNTLYIEAVGIYTPLRWGDLAEHGFNKYYCYFDLKSEVGNLTEDSMVLALGRSLYPVIVFENSWKDFLARNSSEFKGTVDPDSIVSMSYFAGMSGVTLLFQPKWQNKLETVTFEVGLELYGSKSPVLAGLVNPIYSIFAAMWASVLAFFSGIRRVAASALGGFSFSSVMSGLIGDPLIGAVVAIAVIAITFYTLHKPAPRKRRA